MQATLRAIFSRIRALFTMRRLDDDFAQELDSHLALLTEENVRKGMPEAEAKRAARLKFGSEAQLRESHHDQRTFPFIESVIQDIRFALRMLRKNPGFTVVAVLTLALGIGANTAIFSAVNGILLRALPYPQPNQLYAIHEFVPQLSAYGPSLPVNGGNFLAWRKESHAFSEMGLIDSEGASLLGFGQPRWLYGAGVTPEFFSLLDVQPILGRVFPPADEASPEVPEIVLTYEMWRDQFHADPNILGQSLRLGDRGLTVVGVLPANFVFPEVLAHDPAYLVPFPWAQWNSKPGIGTHNYFAIARLERGLTPEQAKAHLDVIEGRIARENAGGQFNLYAIVSPLKTEIVGSTRQALWMLILASGLLLLIVCANLANLLLTKNSKRTREVALRCALGASRWRLVRQFFTETLILAAAGGLLGLLVARIGLRLLLKYAPAGIPRIDQVRFDSTALWFALAASLFAALLFGLLPGLRVTRRQLSEQLKFSGSTSSSGKDSVRLRTALVIGEIALCAALLPACLLLIGSLHRVVAANRWMNEEHVIAADLLVPFSQMSESDLLKNRERILTSVEERVRRLPGIESVGFTSRLPLEGLGWGDAINFQETPLPDAQQPPGEFRFASPGYFGAAGLPLIRGRFFSAADRDQSIAIISKTVAEKLLPGRDPLGMHVECGFGGRQDKWCRIIGEIGDVRDQSDQAPVLGVYFPLWIQSETSETLVARTKMDPAAAAAAIREAIWSVDPELAIPRENTLSSILAASEAPRRYETFLVTLFAFCAAVLAILGLYAVISYSVAQRTHEIGIRMALGASRVATLRMIMREAIVLAIVGIAIGITGALALARVLRSFLFEIGPSDPITFAFVIVALSVAALASAYVPARRAMAVDPVRAMRCE